MKLVTRACRRILSDSPWSVVPVDRIDLPDSNGQTVRLSSFWVDRPALIILWRHFGYECGIDRASMLQNEHDGYISRPERAALFAEMYELPAIPILCDPDFEVYEDLWARQVQAIAARPLRGTRRFTRCQQSSPHA